MAEKPTYEELEQRVRELAQQLESERRRSEEALKNCENRYRGVADESPGLICQFLPGGEITFVNRAYCDYFGKKFDDLVGSNFLSRVPEKDREAVLANISGLTAELPTQSHEHQVIAPNGDIRWQHWTNRGLFDDKGEVIGYQSIGQDVTEQKRAAEALKAQEAFLHDVFNAIGDGISVLDRSLRIIRVNSWMEERYAREGGLPGSICHEAYKNRATPCPWCPSLKALETGEIHSAVVPYPSEENPVGWVDLTAFPLKDAEGEIVGVIEHVKDITDRIRAEKSLQESRETLLTVLNSIDASIYVADMETHEILFMNKNLKDDFGADLTGKVCWKVFRNESGPCSFCSNDKLMDEDGNPAGLQVWDGKNPVTGKWYMNYDRAIKWLDGRYARLQVVTDITDLKKMEDQFRQAQKMESVGRLAGGVAHDFNNALSVIIGFTELAMGEIDPAGALHANLDEVLKAAQRATNTTRQLLAFARRQTIAPKVLDLNENMEGTLKMLRHLIGEDIDFAWLPGKNLWSVEMDPAQIDQILANLCVNARDAIENVGKVTVETGNVSLDEEYCADHYGFTPGEFVMLAVSDDGCGMGQEVKNKIFEPFFTTKDMDKGTGLGMAMVYGIVKQNNGFINVYSEPGRGTTIKIYLPRHEGSNIERQEQSSAPIQSGCGETILLVEDDLSILKLGRQILEGLGYVVLTAAAPGEAIALAEKHPSRIHLLVTDVIMPEMNGRQLAEQLQSFYQDLKCVYMSGYTANVIAHHGVLNEGMCFIQKPFSKQDLATAVRKALDT